MPLGKHLKIIIAIDGSCSVDALNFTGSACRTATLEITTCLGGQVAAQHDKPEAGCGSGPVRPNGREPDDQNQDRN